MRLPMITAHSGCEGTSRDSFESLIVAVQIQAEAAEIDVRMDPSGTLRLSHDKRGSQEAYDSAVLLEDAMAFASKHRLTLNCDMKEPGVIRDVIRVARRHGIPKGRLWITGAITPAQLVCDPDLLQYARFYLNIEEIFKYLYLRECDPSRLAEFARLMAEPWRYTRPWRSEIPSRIDAIAALWRASGAEGINLPYQCLDEQTVAALHRMNIPVSVWTVDDESIARGLLSFAHSGIVNLTTRQVRQTQRLREELSNV